MFYRKLRNEYILVLPKPGCFNSRHGIVNAVLPGQVIGQGGSVTSCPYITQSLVWILAGHTEHRDNPVIKVSHR